MRRHVSRDKLQAFMRRLAEASRSEGRVYLTGGASMLLLGVREQTIDVDIRLDPEPTGAFEAIARLKDELDINVELASPADFIPPPSDWREGSTRIEKIGDVEFYHYDFRAQALSKIERGHETDLADATALVQKGLVRVEELPGLIDRQALLRYPAIDADQLVSKVESFIRSTKQ